MLRCVKQLAAKHSEAKHSGATPPGSKPPCTPAAPAAVSEFEGSLSLTPTDDESTFDVELPPTWMSLVGIHGGFLAAVATSAAEHVVEGRAARTVATSFQRRAVTGPAQVRVDVDRDGRSLSTVTVTVSQLGSTVASVRVTLTADLVGVEWSDPAPIDLPPPGSCERIRPHAPIEHFERLDSLIDPSSLPFTGGDRAMVRGYLRPLEPHPIGAPWLAMASDWFPPAAFVRLEPPLGGVSVDLTTHVHRTIDDLDGAWLTASFEITTSSGGLAVEHGEIRTVDGGLLAESFQTRFVATGAAS